MPVADVAADTNEDAIGACFARVVADIGDIHVRNGIGLDIGQRRTVDGRNLIEQLEQIHTGISSLDK